MKLPAPNRIAVYFTIVAGLAGAIAPAVAHLNLSSTAGVVAGLGAIVLAVLKWLTGWQKYEADLRHPNVQTRLAAEQQAPKS